MPRRAGDAAAGMRPRAAHIKPLHRPAITAVAEHGARRPQLVEAHIAVHDVAADKPELAFEPLGRQPRLRDDARAEPRRVLPARVAAAIRRPPPLLIPSPPPRTFGRQLLAEQAGHR